MSIATAFSEETHQNQRVSSKTKDPSLFTHALLSHPRLFPQVEQGIRTGHPSAMSPSCSWQTPRLTWTTGSRPYGGSSGHRLEEVISFLTSMDHQQATIKIGISSNDMKIIENLNLFIFNKKAASSTSEDILFKCLNASNDRKHTFLSQEVFISSLPWRLQISPNNI